ncbi:tRNA (adenosine(37)-N6)-threonylcarbamoyltransferase complex dimerization subunit type 1 TsaB [Rhizobium sp. BK376]|uniref:tRNA (adenosine(37)-N6)-threonylcarbamoyltransferase complex dimerization subunit type 1 TsaB n=1 Tax=Rhizobium sp. BK376 TaxID=2512149 RepID=UPI00104971A3|nr:tRNA (adenosine(37)-N6)-threonylcarbamoyltransferase complex dimerization subunit type 1 TsaB [Rhizobium sp. BK376]TCR90876.1 N6-L-threonylcarbamoyladenine synthase [Rhizobium sp. BK376]
MIVLALDTAGVDCAVAVYNSDGDSVLGEVTETIGRGHAERLMAILDETLAKAGLGLDAVDRIAVTIGPGSFTGIRVGVAAARGLALSLGIPAVGVTTLETMAAAALEQAPGQPVLAARDAKRDEIYLQTFDENGAPSSEAQALPVADARTLAGGFDGTITGSAAPLLKSEPANDQPDSFPIALVARLGALKPVGEKPKPLYLRGPDARPQAGYAVARI